MSKITLARGARGEEVQRLHDHLTQLGIGISDEERRQSLFGDSTERAVCGIQRDRGLAETGEVDASFLDIIIVLIDERRRSHHHDRHHHDDDDDHHHHHHHGNGGPQKRSASGVVLRADGTAAARTRVRLIRKRLRHEIVLGQAETNHDGRYKISYDQPADAASVDLVLRALGSDNTVVAESPVLYDAAVDATINLSFAGEFRGAPEFTAQLALLAPELDGVKIGDLQQNTERQDLTFLVNATQGDSKKLASVAIAYKVAPKATGVPPEVFYGLFRGGIPSQLASTLSPIDKLIIDDTFVTHVLNGVLAQTIDALKSAIQAALAANVIPASIAANLDAIVAALNALRLAYISSVPYVRGKTPISSLLSSGGVDATLQAKFLGLFSDNGRDAEDAIATLQKDPTVSKDALLTLRFALGAGELLSGNLPVLQDVVAQRTSGQIKAASDLAKLDTAGWTTLINKVDPEAASIPPVFPDETPQQRIARFSTTLAFRFEKRFPTPALLGRLANDAAPPLIAAKDVSTFLTNNTSLELRDMHLDRFVFNYPTAMDGVSDPEAALADLKRVQRVFKLFPSYDVVKPLLADKLDSAHAIYALGEAPFVAKYGETLGQTVATDVYRRAERTYSRALALYTKYNGAFNFGLPQSLGSPPTPPQPPQPASPAGTGTSNTNAAASGGDGNGAAESLAAFPDLQALFGSLDYCQCEDCRSIISPAAYFVDLLQFLGARKTSPTSTTYVREALQQRRPDLWDLLLNCDNTNIPLPFIDLVCETLEDAVQPSSTVKPIDRQTNGSAADLRATPAFVNADAYELLRGAATPIVFPLSMPFDLWIEQSRAYLQALGYTRAGLMRLFQDATPTPSDDVIAAEALAISPSERDLLVGATAGVQPWDLWGLSQNGNVIPDPTNPTQTLPSPSDPNKPQTGLWTDLLSYLPVFQQRAQLSYNDVLQLLDVRFVNPLVSGAPAVALIDRPDENGFVSCDTGHMSLQGLAAATDWTNRANYFLRLWRKTGLPMWDLDRVLQNPGIGKGAITSSLFEPFTTAVQLQARLKLPYDELLSLWGPLDTSDAIDHLDGSDSVVPCAYSRTFLSPAVPGAQDTFSVPLSAGATLDAATTVLAATLKLTADELIAIRADAGLGGSTAALTVASLSTLFAYSRMAAALGISIADLLLWKSIANTPIAFGVTGATPDTTAEFLRRYDLLRATSLTAVDVDYALRGDSADRSSLVEADDAIARHLGELRIGLQKIADKLASAGPTQSDRAKTLLALVPLSPADVATVAQIADGTYTGGNQAAFLSATCPFLSSADITALGAAVTPGQDVQPRYQIIADAAQPFVTKQLDEAFVKQQVAAQTGIELHSADAILSNVPVAAGGRLLIDVLDDAALLQRDASGQYLPLTRAQYPDAFAAYAVLAKLDAIVGVTKLVATEVSWVLAHAGAGKWLDTTLLATSPYTVAEQLLQAAQLKHTLRAGTIDFFAFVDTVLAATHLSDVVTAAAELLGWDPVKDSDQLMALINQIGITLDGDAPKMALLANVERLVAMTTAVKGLGAPASLAMSFGKATPTQADAAAVRQTLKSKYDTNAWDAAVTPIEDALRIKKRDALVSYLLGHPGSHTWQTADDLYAWFLIDTQMEPCMLTARIKQATASVQLFIQRCFLQLEPRITVDSTFDDRWLQWTWMQRYRVWQAAREIFLWPENYLLPEVRPDRSPFFEGLVKQILQSDVTAENTEAAFRGYLRSLADVARLSVQAHYHQVEAYRDVLHVFARSRGTPYTYYYRQCDLTDVPTWAAWQKIDVGITGEHLLAVEWNRRLHLLWPEFAIKSFNVASSIQVPACGTTPTPAQPDKFWEIQIAWSELRDGAWTAKRITAKKLIDVNYTDPSQLCFKAEVVGDNLLVDVYRFIDDGFLHFGQFTISDFYDDVLVSCIDLLDRSDLYEFNQEDRVVASQIGKLSPRNPPLVIPGFNVNAMKPWYQRFATTDQNLPKQRLVANAGNPIADAPLLIWTTNASLAIGQQDLEFDSLTPFFIEDQQRSFFVLPAYQTTGSHPTPLGTTPTLSSTPWDTNYLLTPFYHPFVKTLTHELNRRGVATLLARPLQIAPDSVRGTTFDFNTTYSPTTLIEKPFPVEDIDFTPSGAYALYNWELFYHAPLLVALRLSANQRFDDARTWFEYIFDPSDSNAQPTTDPTPVSHFWKTKPFFQQKDYQEEEIKNLLELVSLGTENSITDKQLDDWRRDPGNADAIAMLRQVAYQKSVVMKYIDNLIAWGDQLFTQDTMETLADATQLYVMASNLLGPRPQETRPAEPPPPATYGQLLKAPYSLDKFSNAVSQIENLLPAASASTTLPPTDPSQRQLPTLYTQYFCIPANPNLLSYWDKVADRLFKIRHCENIEGLVQQLPLYEPPINPMLLVQAAAAGLNLGDVLSDVDAPLPFYRYRVMVTKAIDVCNEVKSFGAQVLAALEKKDAETLATLRATQEVAVLTMLRDAKSAAHDEAIKNRAVLDKTQAVTQSRLDHYTQLKNSGYSSNENAAIALSGVVTGIYAAEAILFGVASALKVVPSFILGASGFGGTPTAQAAWGGDNIAGAGHMAALALDKASAALSQGAQLASTIAGYQRRAEDWDLQIAQAQKELEQITAQQAASDIRVAITQTELDVHDLQTANAQSVSDFLTNKFTNSDLYDYMSSQLSTVHLQSYQLAYELAKKANRCFNFELGTDEKFFQFGYWDSRHKGLTAGELLSFDLRRMEAAYCDLDKRELEITKHFSLALNRPDALLALRSTGTAVFTINEGDFDDDYPGHYFRRLKSVTMTIPCVTGPYVSVCSTLTMTSSSIRVTPDTKPSSLQPSVAGVQAIASSSAQNDAGLFEVNFHDDRYLPFEGQGAVSSWQLELLPDTNAFDTGTISDVILHFKYTAREDASLKSAVLPQVQTAPRQGAVFLSAKSNFPDAFYAFLNPTETNQTFSFDLVNETFPFIVRTKGISITRVEVALVFRQPQTYASYKTSPPLTVHVGLNVNAPNPPPPPTTADQLSLSTNGAPVNALTVSAAEGTWYLTALEGDIAPTVLNKVINDPAGNPHNRIAAELIDDVIIVVSYTAK